ncbi:MAG: TonB-dependent receptor [Novosphingobium sp.]
MSLAALTTAAFAQDTASQPSGASSSEDADTIVVEARRRDERVQDVPLTVNAVTSETIEKLNLRNFQEITAVVPGLSLTPNANGIGSTSSMRGVNQDVNVSGENGTIQFYFNDAPVGSNFVLQAMYDIGQVEVLRGPQGTLRGRSTPSGSITVAPRRPDLSEVGGSVVGTLAEHGVSNLQFGINVPVISDKLAVRVAGLADRNRGNQIRSVNSDIKPRSETESLRASVRAEPLDWLRGGFVYEVLSAKSRSFDQVQSFSNLVPGFTPGVDQSLSPLPPGTFVLSGPLASPRRDNGIIRPKDRLSTATAPRTLTQDFNFYGWDAAADFAGQSLIYVGSHLDSKFHALTNQDVGVTFPANRLFQDALTTSDNETHEIRLQNIDRVAGMFDYVVGYFRQTGGAEIVLSQAASIRGYFPLTNAQNPQIPAGATGLFAVTGAIVNPTPIYIPPSKGKEESFFGNVVAHFGGNTELSAGLRQIQFKNDSQGLFIGCTPTTFAAGSCGRPSVGSENDYDVDKLIYNVSLKHSFNDDLMVYAMTGTSARPPVRAVGNFSTAPTPLEVSHMTLPMETSESYEIGMKSEWLDKKLLVNLTAFHQTFKNYPFRAAQGIYYINVNSAGQQERAQFNFVSAVPVRVNGVEAEVTYAPSEFFNISALTTYTDSKIKSAMLACTDVNRDGVPDTNVPTLAQLQAAYGGEHLAECPSNGQSATFLPKWSGTVQAEGRMPITDSMDGYLRGLVTWRGKSEVDPTNPFDDVGAYGLVNLYAGVRDAAGAWEVSLFVKNLFDTLKTTSVDSSPLNTSLTYVNLGNNRPFGSASYQSYYSGVSVTPPQEFGITARFAFGSR